MKNDHAWDLIKQHLARWGEREINAKRGPESDQALERATWREWVASLDQHARNSDEARITESTLLKIANGESLGLTRNQHMTRCAIAQAPQTLREMAAEALAQHHQEISEGFSWHGPSRETSLRTREAMVAIRARQGSQLSPGPQITIARAMELEYAPKGMWKQLDLCQPWIAKRTLEAVPVEKLQEEEKTWIVALTQGAGATLTDRGCQRIQALVKSWPWNEHCPPLKIAGAAANLGIENLDQVAWSGAMHAQRMKNNPNQCAEAKELENELRRWNNRGEEDASRCARLMARSWIRSWNEEHSVNGSRASPTLEKFEQLWNEEQTLESISDIAPTLADHNWPGLLWSLALTNATVVLAACRGTKRENRSDARNARWPPACALASTRRVLFYIDGSTTGRYIDSAPSMASEATVQAMQDISAKALA